MAKKELTVYFNDKGDLLSYPMGAKVAKPNYEFETTLKYSGYTRGQSAARLVWEDTKTNGHYDMFLSDFDDIANEIVKGKLSGTFTFVKKGCNYGVKKIR